MTEDVVLKLILDSSDAQRGVEQFGDSVSKSDKIIENFQQSVKDAGKAVSNDLVKNQEQAAKTIQNTSQELLNQSKTQETYRNKVREVAGALATSGEASAKLITLVKQLGSTDTRKLSKNINQLEVGLTDVAAQAKLTDDQMKFLIENVGDVSEAFIELSQKSEAIEVLATNATEATTKFTSLKSELKALKNQINSGDLTGDELKIATQRAAELTDQIGDTNEKIKALASDTKGIDTFIEGARSIAAGFSIVQGTMALVGDENEDLQKALVKLNAVMAISQGLQEAHTLLLQNGALATKLASAQQVIYSTVVGQSSGALKIFRIALASTGIGLIVLALGALIANFDKVKEKVTEIFPSLEKLGSVVHGLWDGFVSLFTTAGNVISSLFSGDFSGAYDAAKNVGKNAAKAFDEGFKENELNKANKIIGDSLQKYSEQLKKRAEVTAAAGGDNYSIMKKSLEAEISAMEKHGEKIEDIENKRHELLVFMTERETEIRNKRNDAIKEATSTLRSSLDEMVNLQKEFGQLSEKEIFDLEKSKTIEGLEKLKDTFRSVGKTLGKDLAPEIAKTQELINTISERDFRMKLDVSPTIATSAFGSKKIQLQKELDRLSDLEVTTGLSFADDKEKLQKEIDKVQQVISQQKIEIKIPTVAISPPEKSKTWFETASDDMNRFLEDVDDFEGLLQKSLENIFGSQNGEEIASFVNGLGALVSSFGNILSEATDIQLKQIDKQLDALSKRRETSQDELDKEFQLQQEGLANNYEAKKTEVDGLLAEEDRLTAEREKIQQEAQRRQMIADTVQQSQSLITASINIIKGFANIPIVGLPLGIAAVGALLAFFAKTKADAFAATRLSGGANRISDYFGEADSTGASDIVGRGHGYRVVDAVTGRDTNVRISGREMLIPESITASQRDFFDALKAGRYNFDIADALNDYSVLKKKIKKQGSYVINNTYVQNSGQYVPFIGKDGKSKAMFKKLPINGDSTIITFDL